MKDDIKIIFDQNITLLALTDRIIFYFRRQNYAAALSLATEAINALNTLIESILVYSTYFNENNDPVKVQSIVRMLDTLLDAQTKSDYILLADIYQTELQPFLLKIQKIIMEKEEYVFDQRQYDLNLEQISNNDSKLYSILCNASDPMLLLEKNYCIEYSAEGLITLALINNGNKQYLHSSYMIHSEAFMLASSWNSKDKTDYLILGLGLGYHISALTEVNSYLNIEVYESDINMIQLACAFTALHKLISKSNVKLIYDPDYQKLADRLKTANEETEFIIHNPSLSNINNKVIRHKFEDYFIKYSSINSQWDQLYANFMSNVLNYDKIVDELREDFSGKDLYIIAAGPSLDKNYSLLNKLGENAICLATGTVFRKLLNADIKPDYVIVTDGNPRVYHQINDVEDNNVPMLFLSTAHKRFALNYKGRKHIIFQKNFTKAEDYANKYGYDLYNTGGSVSTTALDIGIQFGCKRIIFLGLDLAFTDDYVHASDTSRRELTSTEGLRQVEDINGNLVYTSVSLESFRIWIENRIRGVEGIEFIDATEGGAKIEGMQIMKLSDCISWSQ